MTGVDFVRCRRDALSRYSAGIAAVVLAVQAMGGLALWAQLPYPVKDLNANNKGSEPGYPVRVGDRLVFPAYHERYGREPWMTDATTEGTVLLKDLVPGRSSSWPGYMRVTEDGQLFFFAYTAALKRQLWVSDGTERGTRALAEFGATPDLAARTVGTRLVFDFRTEYSIRELWVSDGTATGTRKVAELDAPRLYDQGQLGRKLYLRRIEYGVDDELYELNTRTGELRQVLRADLIWASATLGKKLFFNVCGGAGAYDSECSVWITDGTAGGWEEVPDLEWIGKSFRHGNRLLFSGRNELGYELWSSNGTAEGTFLIKDLSRREEGSSPSGFTEVGGSVLFFALRRDYVRGLWSTDGTTEGTRLIRSWGNGTAWSTVGLGDRLLFTVYQNETESLWSTDGTADGTHLVKKHVYPRSRRRVGNQVFFVNEDGRHGAELWVTDGSRDGTKMARDIVEGPESPFPYHKYSGYYMESFEFTGHLFFFADDGSHGEELWTSDGTEAGTEMLRDIRPGKLGSGISWVVFHGDRFLLEADSGDFGSELWVSNGTHRGTKLLRDIDRVSTDSSWPGQLTDADGVLFFSATTPQGPRLWRSDGTAAGTKRVKDDRGRAIGRPSHLTASGGRLFFFLDDTESGKELWVAGNRRKAQRLTSIAPEDERGTSYVGGVVEHKGLLYFGIHNQVWASDGTQEGTRRVPAEIWDVSDMQAVNGRLLIKGFRDRLWFVDPESGATEVLEDFWVPYLDEGVSTAGLLFFGGWSEHLGDFTSGVWVSDGTKAGTRLIAETAIPDSMRVLGDRVLFAEDHNLWVSDERASGASLVKTIGPDCDFLLISHLTAVGDKVFFIPYCDGSRDLWVSDGTAEGTDRVRGGWNRIQDSSYRAFTEFAGRYYFTADDGVHGLELWTSDGTSEGTRMVADLHPGPGSSDPVRFQVSGQTLFFTAYTPEQSWELWALRQGSGTIGSPRLVRVADVDGLGSDELAALRSRLSLLDASSGVALIEGREADSDQWQSIGLEATADVNGNNAEELAVLAQRGSRLRIVLRDALTGRRLRSTGLARNTRPVDFALIPEKDPDATVAAVLSRNHLDVTGTAATLEIDLPSGFEGIDVEVVRRRRSAPAILVLGQTRGRARLLAFDAATGQQLGDARLASGSTAIDLATIDAGARGGALAIVLSKRIRNGTAVLTTLDPFASKVVAKLKLKGNRQAQALKTVGSTGDDDETVAVLWKRSKRGESGVTTIKATTGEELSSTVFPRVQHADDFAFVRVEPDLEAEPALLGVVECAGWQPAVVLRPSADGEYAGCYAIE